MFTYEEYYDLCSRIEDILLPQKQKWENKKIVLYPFGRYGMMIKEFLNTRYGIMEYAKIDNGLCRHNQDVKSIEELGRMRQENCVFVITSNNYDTYDEVRCILKKGGVEAEDIIDLFPDKPMLSQDPRIASLEIASREIAEHKIGGCVAEAGVFRGDYAQYINRFFSDKKLYLFDTFEGFQSEDTKVEKEKEFSYIAAGYYGDTTVDIVMSKMVHKENIVIKKGLFPDTANGLDETFCFVSLDMDLYQPIKAGLEYFWPRMVKGGYIFIHDCQIGHTRYKGARIAVLEFCEKENIGYVMMADNKSAILVK